MKARIITDRIRLRLTPEEVEALVRGDRLATGIDLGLNGMHGFSLSSVSAIHEITVALEGAILQIGIPEQIVHTWAHSDQIGIEASVTTAADRSVFVLIEKDLPCEHPKMS